MHNWPYRKNNRKKINYISNSGRAKRDGSTLKGKVMIYGMNSLLRTRVIMTSLLYREIIRRINR